MPTYLTVAGLKTRWTADRIDGLTGSDDSIASAAIEEAEREVEGVLRSRYGTGGLLAIQTQNPDTVKDLVSQLALVPLYRARNFDQVAPDAAMAQQSGRSRLGRIARGQEDLLLSGNPSYDVATKTFSVARATTEAAFQKDSGPLSEW